MKDKDFHFKNNFKSKKRLGGTSNKSRKNFLKYIINLKSDLKNSKKTIHVLDKDYNLDFKTSKLKKFLKFKTIAIIGMGGSILGTEAIYNFFKDKINKKIYFFNDINEKKILNFKKKEKISKVLFIIISKSGNTIETISNTFSLGVIKKNSKNVIIISENSNNFLYNLSKKFKIFYVEHKNFIGGRYSVLSETGIIPSYLMGINIIKIRSQLLEILNKKNNSFLKESTIFLSEFLNSNQYKNLILLNYSPELENFLYWYQQLVAESLGKKNKGFLPVISSVPKDHHSLLQLYLDGPKDKLFYIFNTEFQKNIKIKFNKELEKTNYLNNKFLNSVKKAQKFALIKALKQKKIPFREFNIKKINEVIMGKLFAYFMIETILIGNLSKINPYDQPAVEQVKIFTKQLLKQMNQR